MQFGTVHTICGHCGKLAYTSTGFCVLCGHGVVAQAVQVTARPKPVSPFADQDWSMYTPAYTTKAA